VSWSRPDVYTYVPNFIWKCSLCRLPVAKNHNFGQILTFGGLLYRPPITDEGQIWCATADRTSTLRCQISSECVHCVAFRWPKTTILGKFWNFRGSCTGSLIPIRVKFGVLMQTGRLHLRSKFHLKVFIVEASSVQKPQFWAHFDFWGTPVPTPYYRWEPNLVCYSWPTANAYVSKFVSIGLFYRSLAAKNPNFCRFFGLRHLVMSTVGGNLRKWNTGAQLQTFPYPTASKSFLYFNILHGEIGRTNWRSKAWRHKRDRKSVTDKQKNSTFFNARWRMKSDRHQTWHGDRGLRARCFTSKTFGSLTHSFAARGHWKFGGNQTPSN